MDVLPATDRVNVFKYGDQARDDVTISPSLIERYQPMAISCKDFNIVDTPGTNTIVADHQAITEQFVPQADLIIFVFSVDEPLGGQRMAVPGTAAKTLAQERHLRPPADGPARP